MAIYCMQCGKELPDDANFCLKCGTPVGSAAKPVPPAEPRWEYCEITCKIAGFMGRKSYFVAEAVGGKGVYEAARSAKLFDADEALWGLSKKNTPLNDEKSKAALNEIITKLAADGWQPAGKDEGWWEYKYRRQVSS